MTTTIRAPFGICLMLGMSPLISPSHVLARPEPVPLPAAQDGSRPLSADQWRADLDELARELPKRHKNAFFRTTKADFESLAASLSERFPRLSDADRALGLATLAASLGDGHTSVDISVAQKSMHAYRLGIVPAADGFVVSAASQDHMDMLGCELVAIDGVPIDGVVTKVGTLYPWENRPTQALLFTRWFNLAEGLVFAGVSTSAEHASFEYRPLPGPDGGPRPPALMATLDAVEARVLSEGLARVQRENIGVAAVSRRSEHRAMWFDMIPTGDASLPPHVMYLRYDRCNDDKKFTIADYCKSVRERLDKGDVTKLIIDLRFNGGGNSALLEPFIDHLAGRRDLREKGSIIVLTGAMTFSSAQLNALALHETAHAVVMGGPTGQKPNAYGEVRTFKLKNSGLTVSYSTKYFKTAKAGDPESMAPDVLVEATMADWMSGRDVVLERAVGEGR